MCRPSSARAPASRRDPRRLGARRKAYTTYYRVRVRPRNIAAPLDFANMYGREWRVAGGFAKRTIASVSAARGETARSSLFSHDSDLSVTAQC
eukprot:4864554-Prymnesium_polylepis.1